MVISPIFSKLFEKLSERTKKEVKRTNSPSTTLVNIGGKQETHNNYYFNTDPHDKGVDKILEDPKIPEKLMIRAHDEVNVTDVVGVVTEIPGGGGEGRLPTKEELKVVMKARGNKPYNAIWDVSMKIDKESGVQTLQWSEN